jgi:hypothetical protein
MCQPDAYACYTIDTHEAEVIEHYRAKYGVDPAKVERVVKGKMRGHDWGWWIAGPVPERTCDATTQNPTV